MPFRTIFTVATPEAGDALETAIACARRWSAHIDVICLSAAEMDVSALSVPDMVVLAPAIDADSRAALQDVRERIEQRLTGEPLRWSVEIRANDGADVARQTARAGRLSDLAVLSGGDPDLFDPRQHVLEALLTHSRVPVLLAPSGTAATFGKVMIAWDGSDAALAAIRAALPILAEAASVEIVIVAPESETMGHDPAVMLDRHGIAASVTGLPRSGRRIAEVLSGHARETGAELMVMGAYGHRRLRDILIGGVTRAMLDTVPLPLFLAR